MAGQTTSVTAITLDVMPTLVELAGGRVPEGHHLDGRSLVGELVHRPRKSSRTLFWEFGKRAAVRRQDWKMVVGQLPGGEVGLFNLRVDLGERTNLAAGEPELVKQLLKALETWRTEVARGSTPQPKRAQKNRVSGS